jgi:SPP1 family predicted phage head-tail adaptor
MDILLGSLRERIAIERPTANTIASTGEHVLTWTRIDSSIPAKIELADTDAEIGRTQKTTGKASVWIRHRGDITTADRIVWAGRNWSIVAITPDPRRRWVKIEIANP